MLEYHPIRVEEVERRRSLRRDENAAALQKKMLAMLSKKFVGTKQLAEDKAHERRQREQEEFDADAEAPWRAEMLSVVNDMRASFEDYGKNIFDMSFIAPMFRHVDVDDIVLEDTDLPYPAVYLHFGENAGLVFAESLWIDGAYLRDTHEDRIEVVFVSNHPHVADAETIPLGRSYKNVTTCVRLVVGRQIPIVRSISEAGPVGDPAMSEASDCISQAIRMTINGLLYLNLPRADLEEGYELRVPHQLAAAARAADPDVATKARRRLDTLGYVKVTFAGRALARRMEDAMSSATERGRATVSPHWRRGHWRRVAYGKGRAERKWHLFEPTVVNGDMGAPKRGKIHVVKPRDQE